MKRRGFLGSIIAAFVAKPVLEALPLPAPVPTVELVVPKVIEVNPPKVVNDIPYWADCTCGPAHYLDVTSQCDPGGFREYMPVLRPYCPVHSPFRNYIEKEMHKAYQLEHGNTPPPQTESDDDFDYYPDDFPEDDGDDDEDDDGDLEVAARN